MEQTGKIRSSGEEGDNKKERVWSKYDIFLSWILWGKRGGGDTLHSSVSRRVIFEQGAYELLITSAFRLKATHVSKYFLLGNPLLA